MSFRVDPPFPLAATPPIIVGREHERAKLRRALDAAVRGSGSLVLISGEAGIGKTTLVEDLAEKANERGVLVLRGDCYDLTTTLPYGPWLEALSGYEPVGEMPAVPSALRGGVEPRGVESQSELFRQFRTFITAASNQIPLLLILEDLHWADSSSLDLLRDVARRLVQSHILLIVTWRVDELDRHHQLYRLVPALVREAGGVRIDLHRFGSDAQRALIAARYTLLERDLERLAAYLRQHAEGNPFFLTELLRTLEEEGLLKRESLHSWRLGDLSAAPVPELVRQVIEARVSRLGERARRLLEIAAVIGYEVPLDLWISLTDVDRAELPQLIERIVDARMLREIPPNSYRFSHALVREAIYDGLVLPSRQALHREVGEILARRPNPDPVAVAHHFQQAADTRAAIWLLRAGEQARRQFAVRVAIDRLTAALSVVEGLSAADQIRAYLERGRAYETLGEFTLAVADATTALGLARDVADWRLEWQTLLDLGVAWSPSNYVETGAYYRQALELARTSGDHEALAVSLNRLGNWHFNLLQLREALDLHQEALGILETTENRLHLAQTHDFLAMVWWGLGDGFNAAVQWDASISLFERLDDRQQLASALNNSVALSLVDFMVVASVPEQQGFARVTKGLQISREIEWRAGEIFALINYARLKMLRGEIDSAIEDQTAAIALAESIEHREWTVAGWWNMGLTMEAIGNLDHSRDAFERGMALARETKSLFWVRLVGALLAHVLIERGELDEAEDQLRSTFGSLEWDSSPGSLHTSHRNVALSELALARGDVSGALSIVDANIASLPNVHRGVVPALSILRGKILAALGRTAEARDDFAAARSWLASFGERPTRLVTCAELGRVCHELGNWDAARQAVAEAREIAAFVAANLTDEPARQTFEERVDELLSYDVAMQQAANGGLSAREVEVLRLVAEGLTDIEVAQRLFLSRRTVSSHLRSIYIKLDVSTRTAATRLAIERGIF